MPLRSGGRPPPRDGGDLPIDERFPGELGAETKINKCLLQAVGAAHRHDLNAEARIQAAIVAWVRAAAPGAPVAVVRSIGDARKAFACWGIGMREARS
jgi:hypothetical protein